MNKLVVGDFVVYESEDLNELKLNLKRLEEHRNYIKEYIRLFFEDRRKAKMMKTKADWCTDAPVYTVQLLIGLKLETFLVKWKTDEPISII